MKANKLLILTPILFIIMVGCEDKSDELVWEISSGSEQNIIQNKVKGIVFKFCLLNEEGIPTTVFNEGENFSFYFSVTNNRNEKLYFIPVFAYSNEDDFCRIYNSSDQDLGKSYYFKGADLIGIGAFPFESSSSCIFQQQWIDNRNTDWKWEHGNFESLNREVLAKGYYYTEFKHNFEFVYGDSSSKLYTSTLSFKIHFKIQ